MEFESFTRTPCKTISCPHCRHAIEFYHYSGMGGLAPHFYCDTCSNILFREEDHHKIRDREITMDLLDELSEDLPACPCGGQFRSEASPKCPHCKREIKHRDNPQRRLTDPYAIQIKGAHLLKLTNADRNNTVQTNNKDNYNPIQGIGCLLIFMGLMFGSFGLAGLTGLASDVELGFFGLQFNDQPGRIFWIIGCGLVIFLGILLVRRNRPPGQDR